MDAADKLQMCEEFVKTVDLDALKALILEREDIARIEITSTSDALKEYEAMLAEYRQCEWNMSGAEFDG